MPGKYQDHLRDFEPPTGVRNDIFSRWLLPVICQFERVVHRRSINAYNVALKFKPEMLPFFFIPLKFVF